MAYDVAIAGGGVMGCATAYHLLLHEPSASVAILERDASYAKASTVLSDGNVRIQFNLEENIRMSQHAMERIATFSDDMAVGSWQPEVSARHQGNLFLVDAANQHAALEGLALQQRLGCEVEWLSSGEVAAKWEPYGQSGMQGGTFGKRDGSVDPNGVLQGYRRKAIDLGAEFIEVSVSGIERSERGVRGLLLDGGESIEADMVLNAAGAWAGDLASTAGVDLPLQPVMRNVFVVDTHVETGALPSVFVPSGLYVIPESGRTFLMAWSQPDDPVGYDFAVHRQRFYDLVWPELMKYFPVFDALDVAGGWAGLYAVNTLDGNAILGEWPELAGLYIANGFSGVGFQQCHAVGRYLAERMLDLPVSLDLSRLGPDRVLRGDPIHEHAGRII